MANITPTRGDTQSERREPSERVNVGSLGGEHRVTSDPIGISRTLKKDLPEWISKAGGQLIYANAIASPQEGGKGFWGFFDFIRYAIKSAFGWEPYTEEKTETSVVGQGVTRANITSEQLGIQRENKSENKIEKFQKRFDKLQENHYEQKSKEFDKLLNEVSNECDTANPPKELKQLEERLINKILNINPELVSKSLPNNENDLFKEFKALGQEIDRLNSKTIEGTKYQLFSGEALEAAKENETKKLKLKQQNILDEFESRVKSAATALKEGISDEAKKAFEKIRVPENLKSDYETKRKETVNERNALQRLNNELNQIEKEIEKYGKQLAHAQVKVKDLNEQKIINEQELLALKKQVIGEPLSEIEENHLKQLELKKQNYIALGPLDAKKYAKLSKSSSLSEKEQNELDQLDSKRRENLDNTFWLAAALTTDVKNYVDLRARNTSWEKLNQLEKNIENQENDITKNENKIVSLKSNLKNLLEKANNFTKEDGEISTQKKKLEEAEIREKQAKKLYDEGSKATEDNKKIIREEPNKVEGLLTNYTQAVLFNEGMKLVKGNPTSWSPQHFEAPSTFEKEFREGLKGLALPDLKAEEYFKKLKK